VKVGEEPEGVTVRPDGKAVYVTSEGDGVVTAVDTSTLDVLARVDDGTEAALDCLHEGRRHRFRDQTRTPGP